MQRKKERHKEFEKKYYNKIEFREDFKKTERLFLKINKHSRIFSNYYYQFLKILFKIPKNSKVLDVGVANGSFLNFIHRLRPDLKLYGLDITDVTHLLPKYVTFIKQDAAHFRIKEKFDMIISNHLIEHIDVRGVIEVFKNINLHLKKNGFFWITTPAFCKAFFDDPTHIKPYSKISIQKLLFMSGFKEIEVFEGKYFKFPFNLVKDNKLRIAFGYGIK